MRLWSLHPRYLDPRGLVALWREGLLAQAVLEGKTRGYKHHPQLARFLASPDPCRYIGAYLWLVHAEALRRGYSFNAGKLGRSEPFEQLPVSNGQLLHEWSHLLDKLRARSPAWIAKLEAVEQPEPHPLFRAVSGGVAEWEVVSGRKSVPIGAPDGQHQP